MCFETYRKCRGNDLYWDSLSDIYRPANLRVFKAPKVRPWWSSFLQKQAPTGSLKNNCLKQQLKPSTKSCMLWKGLLHGFLLHNKPRKTKIKTSKGKIKFLQCRYRRQLPMLMPIFPKGPAKLQELLKSTYRKLSLSIILTLLNSRVWFF